MASTCAGVVLEGTVGVEVFHGVVEGFVYCSRKIEISFYTDQALQRKKKNNTDHVFSNCLSPLTRYLDAVHYRYSLSGWE